MDVEQQSVVRPAGRRRRRAILVLLAFVATVATPRAAQPALASPPGFDLTLVGPSFPRANTAAVYQGVLSALAYGVPQVSVDALVDGEVAASTATAVDGSYSLTVSLSPGTHEVQTVAARATPLETRSPVLVATATVPEPPVLTGTTPGSPSATWTTPSIEGTAEAGSTVRLYTNADCSVGVAATGTASEGTFSIGVSVPTNSTTTFRATAADAVGNVSPCSASSITYVHDSSPLTLAAGNSHTCAIVLGGEVRCWGANGSGQVGDGTQTYRATPVTVSELSGATAITAGNSHTCAIVSGGEVRCWGDNGSGQVGDGTQTPRSTPVTVSGISGAIAITAGNSHTCAIVSGGDVRCWGSNESGELGDGTQTNRSTPVAVSELSDATAISGGRSHTCAVLADDTARCWGHNLTGQLGDGTAWRTQPVEVVW